ncbi:hypothetical protein Anas_08869 [Armadillidium nasatum]|uniref:Uncharacterized protein n=1 Tax=Armadillidium nasatum TaxID=96803 RepID=A0A5N5ST08_9CRUS|nr:hypothetical protein Anas_08869 [Armadillidium nasatum]
MDIVRKTDERDQQRKSIELSTFSIKTIPPQDARPSTSTEIEDEGSPRETEVRELCSYVNRSASCSLERVAK